ncbi:unnamed protein product [Chrysoparadoxa australica]
MMMFCPTCHNLLMVESTTPGGRGQRFCCQTCPYIHYLGKGGKVAKKLKLVKKGLDDILGGEEAWTNVDKTETKCPACDHGEAFFNQIQLRSADEPMTTFYKCVKCKHQWNE